MEIAKYNYHSHTYRCGHAALVDDKEYVLEAIKNNYQKYGITDHVPVHPIFFWDMIMRMHDNDKKEYLKSIGTLKKQYRDTIEIFSGFEAEYDEIIESYLCDLRDSCDYMILGQHYILGKDIRKSLEYPNEYAKKVCKAIESGIFDIVAHPDIFMRFCSAKTDEEKDIYTKNVLEAARMICEKAKEYNLPLELNLGDIKGKTKELDIAYPNKLFWEVVGEVGNAVVVGIDAHDPKSISLRDEWLQIVNNYIDISQLNILPMSYDPISHRKNNLKILDCYNKTKNNLNRVEERLVLSFLETFDGREFDKNNFMLDFIKLLRVKSNTRDIDNSTIVKREELIKVVEQSLSKEDIVTKEECKDILKKDINLYYEKKFSKIKTKR